MAELDYAFIADFARVEPTGTLTVVGASWTFLQAPQLPAAHRMAIAGRIRCAIDEGPTALRVEIVGPNRVFTIAADGMIESLENQRPYGDGLVGRLFALEVQTPLPAAGLYEILIDIDGERARRLAFEVAAAEE